MSGFILVELVGIEPTSRQGHIVPSTCLVIHWFSMQA